MGSENKCGHRCGRQLITYGCDPQRQGVPCSSRTFVSVRSHACFVVVMLKYGPHSQISIIWEVVGTSTRAVACTAKSCTSTRTVCRLYGETKTKFASLAVSPSHRSWRWPQTNQRSAPGSAALQRSGAPSAPDKTTSHKCCDTFLRRANSEK